MSGNHREMGQQIGESRRENVQRSIENARKLLQEAYHELELTWEGAQIQARKYLTTHCIVFLSLYFMQMIRSGM